MGHLAGVVADHAEQPQAFRIQLRRIVFAQDGAETVDGAQRRTQVMRDGIAEALQVRVGGLQLTGTLGQLLGPALHVGLQTEPIGTAFGLQLLARRDVLDQEDKMPRLAVGAPHQRDGPVDPDQRAILADIAPLHRIDWPLPRQELAHRLRIGLQVVRMLDVLECDLRQFLDGVSEDFAQLVIDP